VTAADVVVLGAGPAGLMAAWRAALAGHRVVVVERAPVPGGLAASVEVGGQRVDLGSHRLHPSTDPAVLGDLQHLLGGQLQWRPRNGRLRLDGHWVRFPLSAPDLIRSLPPGFALAAAGDALTGPLRRPRADTFAEVVRADLGPTMLDRFYGPYARKLWGLGPEELAGEQARRRIATRSATDLLARVVRPGRRRGFWYPARGFGAIPEALADAATAAGTELCLGAEVTGVDLGGAEGARVTLADGSDLRARHVWSTLPLPALVRLVRPAAEPAVAEDAGRLTSRGMVLVHLVLARPRWTSYDAHYLPGPEVLASRVSEPKGYRDGPDPPDRTVLCAEVPCTPGDEVWAAPDDALTVEVAAGLEAAGLPAVRPVAAVVRRLPAVYPVLRVGDDARLARVRAWATSLAGVVTLGRGGLFAHDNTHHVLALGRAAAGALRPDGTWDAARWAAARDRAAAAVVED
jgi:protoporphyrinogen oxidase